MTRQSYLHQVKRQLSLPRSEKAKILRDLNEMFDSAAENGETEAAVIERLGSPTEFAAGFGSRKKFRPVGSIILAICAVLLFGISAALRWNPISVANTIGGADGPTQIYVSGPLYLDVPFRWGGIILLAAAVIWFLIRLWIYRKSCR
ncbi:MAG: DUF1700 domain-containing protein [Candidatus Merdivicinus sp.]|jgi:Na+-transporting methylmalonyl-CoA/oxaloacetate decarboxylase beta subunit